ncbi:MAG: transcriptional regulator [Chloroflexi bacterium]|nr:transcriptional regulator [Chloroflexota bacterium]MBE42844.1 transcriptional regulator [Chloroflexota bacterium]
MFYCDRFRALKRNFQFGALALQQTQTPKTPRWTFITNHGLVLSYISHNPTSTAREIANYIGVTERTTHKIISDLENAGYIRRRKIGRRNVYSVDPQLPLRHHTKTDIMVEDLLDSLTSSPDSKVGK